MDRLLVIDATEEKLNEDGKKSEVCTRCTKSESPCTFTRLTTRTAPASLHLTDDQISASIIPSFKRQLDIDPFPTWPELPSQPPTVSSSFSFNNLDLNNSTLPFTTLDFNDSDNPIYPSLSTLPPYPDSLPAPKQVIDNLVSSFFKGSYSWIFILHPRTFFETRYQTPRSLLYAVCGVAARHTESCTFWFQLSLSCLDENEISLNNLCCGLILLTEYALVYQVIPSITSLTQIVIRNSKELRIHIDPDIYESLYSRDPWNLIKKETFRRVFYSLCATGARFLSTPTTRVPLPDNVWGSLSDNDYYYAGSPQGSTGDVTTFCCELYTILRRVHGLFDMAMNTTEIDVTPDVEAKAISLTIIEWRRRLTELYPIMMVGYESPSAWKQLFAHFSGFNLLLLTHRFTLIRYLKSLDEQLKGTEEIVEKESKEVTESNTLRKVMDSEAITTCQEIAAFQVEMLKSLVIPNDPEFEKSSTMFLSITQSLIFYGVMQNYGWEESRKESKASYEYVKNFFCNIRDRGGSKLAGSILKVVETIEDAGWIKAWKVLDKVLVWKIDQYFE
ncbi:hypothetical protein HK098_002879 [Nowakowskiella sp. JEL0407]|nr:hypothetical protein HK098_002879 [Nowakowskiella sp. JEL0407]